MNELFIFMYRVFFFSIAHCCTLLHRDLEVLVEHSLDMYRHELALILYPVFVHMYLELVYNRHEAAAKRFVERYGNIQESFFQVGIVNASALSMQRGLSPTAT